MHWQILALFIRNVQDMGVPTCPKCYRSVLFPQITSTPLHCSVEWLVPCRDALWNAGSQPDFTIVLWQWETELRAELTVSTSHLTDMRAQAHAIFIWMYFVKM